MLEPYYDMRSFDVPEEELDDLYDIPDMDDPDFIPDDLDGLEEEPPDLDETYMAGDHLVESLIDFDTPWRWARGRNADV